METLAHSQQRSKEISTRELPVQQSQPKSKSAEDFGADHLDKLAIKSLRGGNKFRPELPALIPETCEPGGELWSDDLPTERYLPPAPEGGFASQICCMPSAPEDRVINYKKKGTSTRGATMPHVILVTFNMNDLKAAARS